MMNWCRTFLMTTSLALASTGAQAYQCSGMQQVKCDKISYCSWVPDTRSKDGRLIKGYCQVKKSGTQTKTDMTKSAASKDKAAPSKPE